MQSKEEIENNIKEKDSSVVETERIIVEIPKNTSYLSLVCFFMDKDGFNANNQILGIKPIKEKKKELEQLETENKELKKYKQKLIKKLEEESKQLDEETKAIAIKLNEARDFVITDEYEQAENDEYILILEEKYEKANIKRIRTNEILKILKGEANEELL